MKSIVARLATVIAVILGLLLIPASPYSARPVAAEPTCLNEVEQLADPACQSAYVDGNGMNDPQAYEGINHEGSCVLYGLRMQMSVELATSTCALRMANLEKLQLATLATMLDINQAKGRIDTPDACIAYGRAHFVTPNDVAQACSIRMAAIEERERKENGLPPTTANNPPTGSEPSQPGPSQPGPAQSGPSPDCAGVAELERSVAAQEAELRRLLNAAKFNEADALGGKYAADKKQLDELKAKGC